MNFLLNKRRLKDWSPVRDADGELRWASSDIDKLRKNNWRKKRLKRREGILCCALSFRLSPPDTQHNLEPPLITELADISAIVETSAIVTVSHRFCYDNWFITCGRFFSVHIKVSQSSLCFLVSIVKTKTRPNTGETDADVTKKWMKNPIWA